MVRVSGRGLTVDDVVRVAREGARVTLDPAARRRIQASHASLLRLLRSDRPAYGVRTGLGHLENVRIREEDVRTLQRNLVRSHSAGVGEPLRDHEVRATLLARANALAVGASGVRVDLVRLLLAMLNARVHPVLPSVGSLGSSGDLAPLAHLAAVLTGEGRAVYRGRERAGASALRAAGLEPVELQSKEGLALINGTSVMAGVGALIVHDAGRLLKDAQVAASLSFEALRGSPRPFADKVVARKPQPGVREVARNLRRLLRSSEVVPSHAGDHRVQDPYTLRCIPQVLGAVWHAVSFVRGTVETELNSATDNPLIFPGDADSHSGGNFHGESLALAFDHLATALTVLSGFSERRTARLLDPALSDLPAFLTERGGLESGLMLLQYTAVALLTENKVLSHPASVDSLPTSANQEDWNAMGMTSVLKARKVVDNAHQIVAIEYLCGAQGVEFLAPLRPGLGPRAALRRIRRTVKRVTADRALARDVERVASLVRRGDIVAAAESACGRLA